MMGQMPLRKKTKLVPMSLQIIRTVGLAGKYMKDKLSPTQSAADESTWEAVEKFARDNGAVEFGFALNLYL